jgi:hypothetical protein
MSPVTTVDPLRGQEEPLHAFLSITLACKAGYPTRSGMQSSPMPHSLWKRYTDALQAADAVLYNVMMRSGHGIKEDEALERRAEVLMLAKWVSTGSPPLKR